MGLVFSATTAAVNSLECFAMLLIIARHRFAQHHSQQTTRHGGSRGQNAGSGCKLLGHHGTGSAGSLSGSEHGALGPLKTDGGAPSPRPQRLHCRCPPNAQRKRCHQSPPDGLAHIEEDGIRGQVHLQNADRVLQQPIRHHKRRGVLVHNKTRWVPGSHKPYQGDTRVGLHHTMVDRGYRLRWRWRWEGGGVERGRAPSPHVDTAQLDCRLQCRQRRAATHKQAHPQTQHTNNWATSGPSPPPLKAEEQLRDAPNSEDAKLGSRPMGASVAVPDTTDSSHRRSFPTMRARTCRHTRTKTPQPLKKAHKRRPYPAYLTP
jgi:hypothetical protein